MHYSNKQIEDFKLFNDKIHIISEKAFFKVLNYSTSNNKSKEYKISINRRLKLIEYSVNKMFEIISPNRMEILNLLEIEKK